jgi:hypothetical protein
VAYWPVQMVVSKARPLELVHSRLKVRAAAAAIRVEYVTVLCEEG